MPGIALTHLPHHEPSLTGLAVIDRERRHRPGARAAAVVVLVLFAVYAAVSVRRHQLLLTSGYDLGIFEQSVRSWSRGEWPTSRLKGVGYPLLGDHFSPIVALLAPAYRVVPSPLTLLLAQAMLFAVAVIPLFRFCRNRIGAGTAVVVAAAYALSVGVTRAVTFDFHEIAFAVPLLAFALVALVERRFGAALGWSLPLVLVKEDLGLTAAAIALLVAWRCPALRRLALTLAAGEVVWTAAVMLLVIPAINPARANAYTSHITLNGIADPASLRIKLATAAVILASSGFAALRSPGLLAAVPTLGWRFLSDNPAYWGTGYHYGAVLVPVVLVALAEVLAEDEIRPSLRRVVLAGTLGVAVASGLTSDLREVARPRFWHTPAEVSDTRELVRGIPDGASVAASNWLAPQLTGRADVALFGKDADPGTEYVVADLGSALSFPLSHEASGRLLDALAGGRYEVVDSAGRAWLLRRRGLP